MLMDQPHRHGALAHREGDPLDRAAAHVARREHARQARLQEERLSRKVTPEIAAERGTVQRRARQDKTALVELDGSLEPGGVGLGTDEDEEGPRPQDAALR